MPDPNGENNTNVDLLNTPLSVIIDKDEAGSSKAALEAMNVEPFPTDEVECSEHSGSQDSIGREGNYAPAIIETIAETTDEDDTSLRKEAVDGCSARNDETALGSEGPLIRVIPPALALDVRPESGGSIARKSPVTVQEWVDSLPPPRLREDGSNEPWPAPRPSGSLVREPSVQSDAGSHCSSVESLLGSRRADPEQILMGLGFGGGNADCDSEVSRIPRRFLRPSQVKGVVIDDFLKHQHDLVQTFESGFYGYRGLTGSGHRPSVIVAKIMEKLRGGGSSSSSPPPSTTGKRFSRVARKVMNVLPSSVLTPDNRRFLDDQGGKSPEIPRKRMIIGQKSFTFDRDGEMIELRAAANDISLSSVESEKNTVADRILSSSRSLSSSDRDIEDQFYAPNLADHCRSFSLDSSEAPQANSTPIVNLAAISQILPSDLDYSYRPSFSTSSRSVSMESSDSPSLSLHAALGGPEIPWDNSASQRRNRFSSTSLSSWESMSPKGDPERPFPRYESIEETSEKGDASSEPSVGASHEDVRTPLQLRRGSLKRQQRIEEDFPVDPIEFNSLEAISNIEESDVFCSQDTLSQPYEEDNFSMDSSTMECLLNPVHEKQIEQRNEDTLTDAIKVPSPGPGRLLKNLQQIPESSCQEGEAAEQMRGVATLLRSRSDSSGFLDSDGDERNALAAARQKEFDELVYELKDRGVDATNCQDTAVKLALTSFGEQLKTETTPESDLPEARYSLEALSHLREMVAVELRRVADLLDEQPSAAVVPTIATQMTALLRQQSNLRRQLEALSCATSAPLEDLPTCCDMLDLVRDEHRHLERLVQQNSRELADIRELLHELLATHR